MTRSFNQHYNCTECGALQTQETRFSRWIRNNEELDSRKGYAVSDQDFWIHKFRTDQRGRNLELLMLVEVKTCAKEPSKSQDSTLWMVDQLMRNRTDTPTVEQRPQAGRTIVKARSSFLNGVVHLRAFGLHVLTFSGLGPDDSHWMAWDGREINLDQLTKLLRFDLDPDTLKPLDLRIHHPDPRENNLDLFKFSRDPAFKQR